MRAQGWQARGGTAMPNRVLTVDWGGGTVDVAYVNRQAGLTIMDAINLGGSDVLRGLAIGEDATQHLVPDLHDVARVEEVDKDKK